MTNEVNKADDALALQGLGVYARYQLTHAGGAGGALRAARRRGAVRRHRSGAAGGHRDRSNTSSPTASWCAASSAATGRTSRSSPAPRPATCATTRTPRSSAWCGGSATRPAPGRRCDDVAAGNDRPGLVTFAAMLAFVDALRSGVGTAMNDTVAAVERRRLRVPGLRDAAAGEVLRRAMGTEYIAVVVTILFTIATSLAARPLHVQGLHRPAHAARPGARADRAAGPARHRRRRRATSRTGSSTRSRCSPRTSSCGWSTFADRLAAGRAAAQPRRHRQHGADAGVQHHLELRRPTPTCSTTAARPGCRTSRRCS